jgi:hypothetical protein
LMLKARKMTILAIFGHIVVSKVLIWSIFGHIVVSIVHIWSIFGHIVVSKGLGVNHYRDNHYQ